MTPTHQYLEQMVEMRRRMGNPPKGYNYRCMEDYVLTNGQLMASTEWSDEEQKLLEKVAIPSEFKPRQCFYNAQMLALRSNRFTYYEGFGSANLFPMLHGWCLLDNQKIVDVTWRKKFGPDSGGWENRILGVIPEGFEYLGFPVKTERVRERILRTRKGASFLDDPEEGFPLLKDPRPVYN